MENKRLFLLKNGFFLPLWEIISKKRDKANTGKYKSRAVALLDECKGWGRSSG